MFRDENWEVVFETPAPEGAALLDEKLPGWADKIDLDAFVITSIYSCVLGQLYGGYGRGLGELFGEEIYTSNATEAKRLAERVASLGFDMSTIGEYDYSWGDLQKEWEYLIGQRRTVPVDG